MPVERNTSTSPSSKRTLPPGAKRYNNAAYYCALLAEIAIHTGHVEAFKAWYADLLTRYKRKRSLPRVLDTKVRPVLQQAARG